MHNGHHTIVISWPVPDLCCQVLLNAPPRYFAELESEEEEDGACITLFTKWVVVVVVFVVEIGVIFLIQKIQQLDCLCTPKMISNVICDNIICNRMDFAGLALKNHFNLCLSPTFGGRLSSTFPCRSKYFWQQNQQQLAHQAGRGEVWACRGAGGAHQVSSYGVNFSFRWFHQKDDIVFMTMTTHDHIIRETMREGWVSEVAEGQFPYLYFWPCWSLKPVEDQSRGKVSDMRKFLICECETIRRGKLFPSPSPSKKVLKCILLLDDLVFLENY